MCVCVCVRACVRACVCVCGGHRHTRTEDKMECYAKRPAFITLKDRKENFKINQKCRLINSSKSEMSTVSKKYLENIISKLNSKLQYNQ